ncbi:MAG: hypothetical protein AAB622_00825 [Patescibacteria group bacterium]
MTLTNGDFKNIKQLIKITLDEDESLVRKDDIKHLPSKEEFYEQTDKIMGELKAVREEMTILRIEKVEKKLNIPAPL